MRRAHTTLTYERAKEVVRYDPDTGEFYWTKNRGRRCLKDRKAGSVGTQGYVVIEIDAYAYSAGRLAWLLMTGEHPMHEIDHIDRCKTNNRWSNLRHVTPSENSLNRVGAGRPSSTGVKGVIRVSASRWRVQFRRNRKLQHVGYYKTFEDAALAADNAQRALS